jgi:curli production assembly/transport component CsgF
LKELKFYFLALAFVLVGTGGLYAQQLVYQPINPSFGGNPLNGNWLLSSAQLQDNTTDPAETEQAQDPFADFQSNLNRSILSQLSRNLTNQIFGEGGELQEGLFQLGDFSIEVIETLDGVQITIFDLLTGNETVILVPFP